MVDLHRSSALSFGVYSFDSRAGRHRLGFTASVALPAVVRGARATDEDSRERLAVRLDPRGSTLAVRLDPRRPARPSRCSSTLAVRLDPRGVLYVELGHRSPADAFRRRPAVDGGAVFGASLAGTGDTTPEVTIIGNRSVPKL